MKSKLMVRLLISLVAVIGLTTAGYAQTAAKPKEAAPAAKAVKTAAPAPKTTTIRGVLTVKKDEAGKVTAIEIKGKKGVTKVVVDEASSKQAADLEGKRVIATGTKEGADLKVTTLTAVTAKVKAAKTHAKKAAKPAAAKPTATPAAE